jgi:hypothetical protein
MGYGIDSRSAPRTSGRRSGRHRPSTDPRTALTAMSQRIDAHHRKRRTADRLPGRKAGWHRKTGWHRKEGRVWRRRPAGSDVRGRRDRLT